ncbi:glycine zipper 2TM domain-containing protein [Lysobacter solisilvae (ex Woo and Kim 2020)]|uniref:Glycine zipper 2TM domain-containing protein n=1 Tax=Agrilutibacter terrestris TaxID=2865112 RepID=A0A7H0FY38_9GAMM|nr:glycine zipper 2TM domain-containing protein [Lysobacter terrestris]QNP40954.1 glycine zipper 2TM domain-containing protein [Lysobacter terrestris]
MNLRNPLLTCVAAASIALAGCASSPGYRDSGYSGSGYGSGYGQSSCYDCGTVTRIEQVGQPTSGVTGAVLGGIVGAAAGREIADDKSTGRRNTATAAGAVAGAVAGSAIERNVRGARYNVYVRMDDGRTLTVTQTDLNGVREGSYVRIYNGRATLR